MIPDTIGGAASPRRRHPAPPDPDDGFRWHGGRDEVDAGGIVIPGLRASFYRRPAADGRVETLGLYDYGRWRVFAAWGFVGERHCRYNAVRADGGWHDTRRGCPVLAPIREGGEVVGFTALAGRVVVPFRLADLAVRARPELGGSGGAGSSVRDGGPTPAVIMAAWKAS